MTSTDRIEACGDKGPSSHWPAAGRERCWFLLREYLAALLDWPSSRDRRRVDTQANDGRGPAARRSSGTVLDRARRRPIVFRETWPRSFPSTGLSFYGGVPVGPAHLDWPRSRKQGVDTPLTFLMQWDCIELARHDATGLLPAEGALYLFLDLTWGDPIDFRFVHAPGPADKWRALAVPPDLPPVYGDDGVRLVSYCSPEIAKDVQDVPVSLPKWPFTPVSFDYPAPLNGAVRFWDEGEPVSEALLAVQHPDGVPPATLRDSPALPFARPFPEFPHDYAAVRFVTAEVLGGLRRPEKGLLREASEPDREATFESWRDEARRRYALAATHPPGAKVARSECDSIWRWMEELKPLLEPGWRLVVEECANSSLGLESEAISVLPPDLIASCAGLHKLAAAYLHYEPPDGSRPEAMAAWEARRAEGSLQKARTIFAPCPNHMFGPPSFVQGYVEKYLGDSVLLLQLSTGTAVRLGDGVLQFLVRPDDLRRGRFEKVMLVASSY